MEKEAKAIEWAKNRAGCPGEKKGGGEGTKGVQHEDFPGGHPS